MASQYPLQNDEIDDTLDDEHDRVTEALDEDEDEVEVLASILSKNAVELGKASRERLREELNRHVEAFLARGGHIHHIPSNLHNISYKNIVSDFSDHLM